jgi:16S rRNA (guanine527-N7)-methyltransferase
MNVGLAELASDLGVGLTEAQLQAFEELYRELLAWNSRVNLTSITEREQVMVKHFADSLSVARVLPAKTGALIDIGSGAGMPGLPLKIALPGLKVTLLEATGKKVAFLNAAIAKLGLSDVTAVQARAEDLSHSPDHRECYGVAVARAVAGLPTLLEYALPFVCIGGLFVAQKGIEVEEEIERAGAAFEFLGGRLRNVVEVRLPGLEPRHLVVVEKVAPTPPQFPRRPGVPEKKPLSRPIDG